jgi:hypothetical protein
MSLDEFKTVSEMVHAWFSIIAILIGGVWVLVRFVLQREAYAKMEFGLELHVLGRVGNDVLVNVIAVVTNRGAVRHYLHGFWFVLNALKTTDPIELGGDEIDGQVKFNLVTDKRYWIAEKPKTKYFIDPGATQRYVHVTKLPASVEFVLVYGRFQYPGCKKRYHSAQNAFALPALTTNPYIKISSPWSLDDLASGYREVSGRLRFNRLGQ